MARTDLTEVFAFAIPSTVIRMFLWFAAAGGGFFLSAGGDNDFLLFALYAFGSSIIMLWGLPAIYCLFGCLYRIIVSEHFTIGYLLLTVFSAFAISSVLWNNNHFTLASFALCLAAAIGYRVLCKIAEKHGAP